MIIHAYELGRKIDSLIPILLVVGDRLVSHNHLSGSLYILITYYIKLFKNTKI